MNDAERDPDQTITRTLDDTEDQLSHAVSGTPEQDEQNKAFAELNDQFLRLAADFENFKRRTSKERESIVALANERFAIDLLDVVDNFDRALKSDDSHLREGLEQIRQLFGVQLQRHGIMPIDSLNKPFNPVEHEAIALVPSGEPEGTVIDEVTKGYRMNEKVIRHAKVAVSKGNQN
ncbi:MAG TPA: nucleotide exchange factor GrpE [Methanoregula sp.]|nr:nucleotide exchange factor GrpE [Methanoregula sp.]